MGCSGDPSEEVLKLIHLKVKCQDYKKNLASFQYGQVLHRNYDARPVAMISAVQHYFSCQ